MCMLHVHVHVCTCSSLVCALIVVVHHLVLFILLLLWLCPVEWYKVVLEICYDMRYTELTQFEK